MLISASALPLTLLDLTFFRVSGPLQGVLHGSSSKWNTALRRRMQIRGMHQAGLSMTPDVHRYSAVEASHSFTGRKGRIGNEGTLKVRPAENPARQMTELERRVQALQDAVAAEETQLNHPALSEEDLLTIYEDLLAIPSQETKDRHAQDNLPQYQADQALIHDAEQRLLHAEPLLRDTHLPITSSLYRHTRGSELANPTLEGGENAQEIVASVEEPFRRVLLRLCKIVTQMETVQSIFSGPEDESEATKQTSVPISILSHKEWEALVRVCLHHRDGQAAEMSLNLMRRSGLSPAEDLIDAVIMYYAEDGNIQKTEEFMANTLTASPTELQRDLHIKCHIRATPKHQIPTTALSVLHHYETQSLPAPMRTYTRLITSLFSSHSSVGHAQAWDLFSHMRYVAHPEPDALLYTLMIRACASSLVFPSEPERALDLWTEMTIDHSIPPTAGAYGAVILACARSGTQIYVHEAFRLAKEMFDAHRDAYGRSEFLPDNRTFCSLLEGAKRVGDLARTRWILAEMVKWSGNRNRQEEEEGKVEAELNEEVMMHVFHAYASYRPPFRRASTVLRDDLQPSDEPLSEGLQAPKPGEILHHEDQPAFSHIPPHSRSEVVAEVKTLFNRILEDTGKRVNEAHNDESLFADHKVFKSVRLTPRLVNSYLSVYYTHSSLEVSEKLFRTLFDDLAVHRNAHSYVEALERCTLSRRGHERTAALSFAEHLWVDWEVLEGRPHTADDNNNLSPRLIERAHIAMIRILTLTGNLDRALNHVKAFVYRYPSQAVCQTPPKSFLRSTRTVLMGPRPLVRMTSTTQVPDDTVPPLLTFTDLEVLHHRLVAANRADMIGYIKFVCKAYEGALRMRRDFTMRAEPVGTA